MYARGEKEFVESRNYKCVGGLNKTREILRYEGKDDRLRTHVEKNELT